MKKLITLSCALLALAATGPLQAVTILQGTGENYIKFQAGDYDTLNNTATSVITDNGDGTLTTTLRDDDDPALLSYSLQFDVAGDYYLYFNASSATNSNDSLYVTNDFGSAPATETSNQWNNLNSVTDGTGWIILDDGSGGSAGVGAGVLPTNDSPNAEYNKVAAVDEFFTVDLGETGSPVTLQFRPRETSLTWNTFVLSTNADLTATELNNLTFSPIPEPSAATLLIGALGLTALLRRRRR